MRALPTGYLAMGFAMVVAAGPGASAQEPQVAGPDESPATAQTRVTVAVPTGRVSVGPEFVDGEPVYARRTKTKEGMTIVEVSTTPFLPVLALNEKAPPVARPDQPASW